LERKLAAILCADVYGYSRLMGDDEEGTLRTLSAYRKTTDSLIERHHGRFVNSAGDSILAEFASVVEAVNCAVSIQSALRAENAELPLVRRMQFRIGVNLGDVMVEGEQIYGDGVNVAARLESLADPGGICISDVVHGQVRTKLSLRYQDLGQQHVKNIAEPVRVLRVLMDGAIPAENPAERIAGTKSHLLLAAIGLLLFAASVYGVAKWKLLGRQIAEQLSPNARTIRSIAVLPLDNFSGDPNQEYFADGMTDELTTDLATISALRVISRGSVMQYKGAHRPPTPEIAKALNVDAVVEGSVMRVGDRVRITAQLIDAPADKHLWAKSYQRDSRDVLALQDELAAAIARQINIELTPAEQARFANAHPVNPQAHEAYLKGRYYLSSFTEEGVSKAIGQFEQAIKADASFALPYTGLADAYSYGDDWYFPANEVMPKAKAAAEKALQLDDSLAEAHASLAFINWQYDFDWAGGESEYRRAIGLNPNYAEAHHQYGYLLAFRGRFDESLSEMKRAGELDPLSAGITNDVGFPLTLQAKYEAAKEQARLAMELDSNFYLAHWALGWMDIEAGNFSAAIPQIERARVTDSPPFVAGWLGYAYAATGERGKAEAMIAELNQMSSRRFVSPFCIAIIYLGLGDKERALNGLEKAYEARLQWLTFLKVDRVFDPLRADPRFIELLKKVGLDK
jgi:adenylate cyclase